MRILLIIIRVQNLLSGQVDSLFPPPEIITHWKIENFKESGEKFVGYLIKACGLNPNEKVLDVGCGIGRMAIPLTKYLTSGSYDGFDIVESGIKWCREYITRRFPKFHFQKADIYNRAYNPMGKYKASEYRFPYKDESFDFIFLSSIFIHMLPEEVENYFSEIARVLKSKGRCVITFFLLNDESLKTIDAKLAAFNLDFKYEYEGYRLIDKNIPEAGIAYDEEIVRSFYKKYGLSIVEPFQYGYLRSQDIVLAVKEKS